MSKLNLLAKRLSSGVADMALVGAFSLFLPRVNIGANLGFAVIWILMFLGKTSFGGALMKTSIVDFAEQPIKHWHGMWRILILFLLWFLMMIFVQEKIFWALFLLIVIDIFPYFFTQKNLMLHDMIARSYIKNQETAQLLHKKSKSIIWLLLVFMLSAYSQNFYLDIKSTLKCTKLFENGQFQEVINECEPLLKTTEAKNLDLHYLIGLAYYNLKDYNLAISEFSQAKALGHKKADYFIGAVYFNKAEHDNLLKWYQNLTKIDNFSISLVAGSYAQNYEKSRKKADFVMFISYLKVIKSENIKNHMLKEIKDVKILGEISDHEIEKIYQEFSPSEKAQVEQNIAVIKNRIKNNVW